MKFIALKTEDGAIKGKIRFYCGALNVSRQGFNKWLRNRDKPYKYAELADKMRKIIAEDECNDKYGRERMRPALLLKKEQSEADGKHFPHVPSESTVYRIMQHEELVKPLKRTPNGITKEDKEAQKSDNLLKQNFTAENPCEKTVGDITEVPCSDDKLYIGMVWDCFDNAVLGLSMDTNMKAPLVCDALEMAVKLHPDLKRNKAIFHSDRGSQYTSELFRGYISKFNIRQSMNSAAGRCHDNAKAESLFARFKEELLYGRYDTKSMTVEEVKSLVWRYFMSYWNNRRICTANGGLPPMVKRSRYYAERELEIAA